MSWISWDYHSAGPVPSWTPAGHWCTRCKDSQPKAQDVGLGSSWAGRSISLWVCPQVRGRVSYCVLFWQEQLSHINGEGWGHLFRVVNQLAHRGGDLLAVSKQQRAAMPIIPSQWGANHLSMAFGLQSSWFLWHSAVLRFMNIITDLKCRKNIDPNMALGTSLGEDIMMNQEAASLSDISMVSGNCLNPFISTALTGL